MSAVRIADAEIGRGHGLLLAPAVEEIAAAVQVTPAGEVLVCSRIVARWSAPRRERLRALERALYERFHTGRLPAAQAEAYPDERFRERLERAVRIPWTVERGWRVLRAEGTVVEAERRGLRLRLDPPRHLAPATAIEPGREVEIRLPPTRPSASPGFFTVVSQEGAPLDRVGRLYLNLPTASAATFLEQLTGDLRDVHVRWAVKTLADPGAYGRRDGTVVYIEAATRDFVAERVQDALARLPQPERPDTPPLTLQLTRTLGYADEPASRKGRALSFGQHRMSVIADALLRQRTADPERGHRHLRLALLRAGIDPMAPYRNRSQEAV